MHEENLEIQSAVFSKRKNPIGPQTRERIYPKVIFYVVYIKNSENL